MSNDLYCLFKELSIVDSVVKKKITNINIIKKWWKMKKIRVEIEIININRIKKWWKIVKKKIEIEIEIKIQIEIINSNRIKKWWRKNNSIQTLKQIKYLLETSLHCSDLQELSNNCKAITNYCKGDGCGLLGGGLIDLYLNEFFKKKIPTYEEFHEGESDMKINNIELSQKKISGKSTIALNWSKNEKDGEKEKFKSNILIINLKTEKWWKLSPRYTFNQKICYNETIESGIYIIDNKYCKKYVQLSTNNKTNTLIDSQYLYTMLKRSLFQQLFLKIPEPNKCISFNILDCFSE